MRHLDRAGAHDPSKLSAGQASYSAERFMTKNQTGECTEAALLHPATGQGTAESPSLASVRQTSR